MDRPASVRNIGCSVKQRRRSILELSSDGQEPLLSLPNALSRSPACSLQCSMSVCALEDQNEVFLMNTFTDAQLIVSSDVAALLDRVEQRIHRLDRRRAGGAGDAGRARLHGREPRDGSGQPAAVLPRGAREPGAAPHHRAHHAAVQLRLRLLHPGGPRRLQQARREDVDRDRGPGRRLDRAAARRAPPGELRADVLRRRAPAQPAGDVLPRRADVEGVRRARRAHADQRHHQRAAADPGDRRSVERLRPQRHQDHARRRS